MHVIAKKTLVEFWHKHKDAEEALRAWYQEAEDAGWNGPNDIRLRYPNADFLLGNLVVFNIKGNHYRLIARLNYQSRKVYIRFIGTHAEYDRARVE